MNTAKRTPAAPPARARAEARQRVSPQDRARAERDRGRESLIATLLDPTRLTVLGALLIGARTTDQLTAHLDGAGAELGRDLILRTVGDLRAAGFVVQTEDGWAASRSHLVELATALLPQPEPVAKRVFSGMTDDEREVIAKWFTGERLPRIPRNRSERAIVLERLALEFDVGVRYEEAEVNAILHPFNDDWSTLRRALVDDGLLDRNHNVSWRSGGRVDV